MQIAEVMKKMVAYSEGNTHDINHLLKVWAYAKTIGELEKLDEKNTESSGGCGHTPRYCLPALQGEVWQYQW